MLADYYDGKSSSDLFEARERPYLAPFMNNSAADNTKLKNLFAEVLDERPFKRNLSVASVDLDGGQVVLFDESLSNEERVNTLISSAAVPFAFPFEEIDGMALVDGSLFTTISIGDPISRCREEVEKDEDIIVDVIMCYSDVKTIK